MYQLIAFDMDGTLLTSQQTISTVSLKAIDQAIQAKKQVVLATGRPLSEIKPYRQDLASLQYAILESGAVIYDLQEERMIHQVSLPPIFLQQLLQSTEGLDVMVVVMSESQGYIQESHFLSIENYYMDQYQKLYQATAVFVANIHSLLADKKEKIENVNLYFKTVKARDHYLEAMDYLQVAAIKAEKTGIEITARGANKGQALTFLVNYLQLEIEQTIAVGDGDNDRQMIAEAGLGIAMGNANRTIKALAKAEVASNDKDGCAQAIYQFLLK